MPAQTPPDEAARLAALRRYAILDTDPEEGFDDLVRLAAHLFGAPIALVSLVDEKRQWFKARCGLDAHETSRDIAFCAHAILGRTPMVVRDALQDERFRDSALVVGPPHVRFYAGAPLLVGPGSAIGTLCVIDSAPREAPPRAVEMLEGLARQVVARLDLRRNLVELQSALDARDEADRQREALVAELTETLEHVKRIEGLLPICSCCKAIRDERGDWSSFETYLETRSGARFTHSYCPTCVRELYPEVKV